MEKKGLLSQCQTLSKGRNTGGAILQVGGELLTPDQLVVVKMDLCYVSFTWSLCTGRHSNSAAEFLSHKGNVSGMCPLSLINMLPAERRVPPERATAPSNRLAGHRGHVGTYSGEFTMGNSAAPSSEGQGASLSAGLTRNKQTPQALI